MAPIDCEACYDSRATHVIVKANASGPGVRNGVWKVCKPCLDAISDPDSTDAAKRTGLASPEADEAYITLVQASMVVEALGDLLKPS